MNFFKLTIIFGLAAVQACAPSSSSKGVEDGGTKVVKIKNINPGNGSIAVLGDSLAKGYGSKRKELTPLNCLMNSFNDFAYDYSELGATSSDVLKKIDRAFLGFHLIFVSAGGNDVLLDLNTPGVFSEAETVKNMTALFDKLLATKAVIVYLELNPPIPQASRLPQVATIARERGILVVDGMNGFWADPKTYMSDSIHPNDLGYEVICKRVVSSLAGIYP